jgi:serine/threonine protein kinase
MARACFAPGDVVGNYKIHQLIGQGGFGDIYCVINIATQRLCAMKIEMTDAGNRGIRREISLLSTLQGSPVFPRIETTGRTDVCLYYVMELLGPSLSTIRRNYRGKLPLVFAIRCGVQMLKCIEQLHRRGFIHRDIKPGNFLIRADRVYPICLIDFGLATSYVDCESGVHLDLHPKRGFVGTARYASNNALRGRSLSRRDDIFSWFYSVIELIKGKLPWPSEIGREELLKLRKRKSVRVICSGLPKQMKRIYRMILKLDFEEMPDFPAISALMNGAIGTATGGDAPSLVSQLLSSEDLVRLGSFASTQDHDLGDLYAFCSAGTASSRRGPEGHGANCCDVC